MEFSSNNQNKTTGGRQQSATQQLIAENVKHLIAQLEAGHSETLTAYLTAMARFHKYSFGNILAFAHASQDAL